jgi:hypothetical protein
MSLSGHPSDNQASGEVDPSTSTTQLFETNLASENPPNWKVNWKVIGGLRSIFTPSSEDVLCHNYDIPSTINLHFPSPSLSPLENVGEICVYERMLKAGLRFPFPKIARELLCYLGVAPFQIAPNGWRFLIACYLLWPELNPGHEMSIEEFLNVYRPFPCKEISGVLSFTARERYQVIGLGGSFSNNKEWHKEFFFVSGNWECPEGEDLPPNKRVPRSFRPLHKDSK